MSSRLFQVQKPESKKFSNIQDASIVAANSAIVADGATQGFRSGDFARFMSRGIIDSRASVSSLPQVIEALLSDYKKQKVEYSSNPAIQSLEKVKAKRGGTTTLTYASVNGDIISFFNLGDSSILLVDRQSELKWALHSSVDDIDSCKNWVYSSESGVKGHFNTGTIDSYQDGDTLVLVSDALARYFLEDNHRIKVFFNLNSFEDFNNVIQEAWRNNTLEKDDVTLIFWEPNSNNITTYLPFEDLENEHRYKQETLLPMDKQIKELISSIERLNKSLKETNAIFQQSQLSSQKFKRNVLILLGLIIGLVALQTSFEKIDFVKDSFNVEELFEGITAIDSNEVGEDSVLSDDTSDLFHLTNAVKEEKEQ